MGFFDRLFGRKQEVSAGGVPIYRSNELRSPTLGPPPVPVEWAEARESFYSNHFGEIIYVSHPVLTTTPHIDVYVCGPDHARGRDFYTFVTGGMSDLPQNIPPSVSLQSRQELRRAELIMYVSEQDYDTWREGANGFPCWWLRWLAELRYGSDTFFGPLHTVQNGTPPEAIIDGSQMTTAFFLPALYEAEVVRKGLRLGSDAVFFLWTMMITDAECQYKLDHGAEKLYELLRHHSLLSRTVDMFRPSCV